MENEDRTPDPVIRSAQEASLRAIGAAQDLTPSQVVRQLIREHLASHGIGYTTQWPMAEDAPSDHS